MKGVYLVLAMAPLWITAMVLVIFCIGILYPGRKWFEGMAYNVAFSSNYGDMALIGVPLIGIWILQTGGNVPMFANSSCYQSACAIIAVAVGIACHLACTADLKKKGRTVMVMDSYHNLVVIPLLVYLILFINIPIMIASGSFFQWLSEAVLVFIWTLLVFVDFKMDRLDQQMWLWKNRSIKMPIWKLPKY
jgi:hypothetical protein